MYVRNIGTCFSPICRNRAASAACAGPGTANASSRTPCRCASATPWWPWAALRAGLLAMGSWYPRPRDREPILVMGTS